MSQTDVGALPHLPPAPDVPGGVTPEMLGAGLPQGPRTTTQVEAEMAKALDEPIPVLDEAPLGIVTLPAGWVRPSDQFLVKTARVRELNGFDEERLSRFGAAENVAKYITEMLLLGVEELGDEKPDKNVLRQLLIGDRDALVIGIRIATYGPEIEYKLVCGQCDNESMVTIDLTTDIPTTEMEDPLKREFEVELRHGAAKVVLLDGFAQEKFSQHLGKKTQAEIDTIMLANSVIAINGIPTNGKEDSVRALSSADRGTLMEFVLEHQPGPEIGNEIETHCATCSAPYPVILSLPSMFRF